MIESLICRYFWWHRDSSQTKFDAKQVIQSDQRKWWSQSCMTPSLSLIIFFLFLLPSITPFLYHPHHDPGSWQHTIRKPFLPVTLCLTSGCIERITCVILNNEVAQRTISSYHLPLLVGCFNEKMDEASWDSP